MSTRLRFLADEDLDHDIVRGLRRRAPALDIVRVQEIGLAGAADPVVLARAAQECRALLTHDVSTIEEHAYKRVCNEQRMPGVFALSQSLPVGVAIEEILILFECSSSGEWEDQVHHLPL